MKLTALKLLPLLLALPVLSHAAADAKARPNVLFITSDDLRPIAQRSEQATHNCKTQFLQFLAMIEKWILPNIHARFLRFGLWRYFFE